MCPSPRGIWDGDGGNGNARMRVGQGMGGGQEEAGGGTGAEVQEGGDEGKEGKGEEVLGVHSCKKK
jgi:hypothetical protein